MKQTGWTDEQLKMFETEAREQERFEQAYDEYNAHVARVPIPANFDTTEDYETALDEWSSIAQTLREYAQELQRTS